MLKCLCNGCCGTRRIDLNAWLTARMQLGVLAVLGCGERQEEPSLYCTKSRVSACTASCHHTNAPDGCATYQASGKVPISSGSTVYNWPGLDSFLAGYRWDEASKRYYKDDRRALPATSNAAKKKQKKRSLTEVLENQKPKTVESSKAGPTKRLPRLCRNPTFRILDSISARPFSPSAQDILRW